MKKLTRKKFLLGTIFLIGIYLGYKELENKIEINDNKKIIDLVVKNSFQEENIIKRIANNSLYQTEDLKKIKKDYNNTLIKKKEEAKIYLYNSHPTEEYQPTTIGEYSLNPTVIINNYILEDIFNKNGYKTYVEEESVKDILEANNWNYAQSYRASRLLLEKRKEENPTLEYFIDIHRDSISKEKTTTTIEDRTYAKLLFIVGLENENYEKNLAFTEKINQKLEENYPGLTKGIYKKEGVGVNGVYNQDFSPKTILVEIGGYENTTVEVLNSSIAFAKCFLEAINEENA